MARRDKESADTDKKPGRIAQIRSAYKMTKEQQPRIGLLLLGLFLGVLVVFLGVGFLLSNPIMWTIMGVPSALLVVTIIFGRRVEKAAYSSLEGQLGAGANALSTLRKGWKVDPAISVTRNEDVVHRAVGRPGIILVGEGAPNRISHLLANEKRKHARVAPDTPIYDVVLGEDEGEVPLPKLAKHVMKLPRNLKPAEVREVLNRIKALNANRPTMPIPKGPLPKNVKLPPGSPRVR